MRGMTVPTAELIYLPGCPNVAEARAQLVKAFVDANLTPHWTEYRADDPDLPAHARGFGSPTILVDGRDVTGAGPAGSAEACRLYADETGGRSGIPPLKNIAAAIKAGARSAAGQAPRRPRRRWRLTLAALPGVGFALLPKLACPACWPAYAGILGSLGLGFLIDTAWLLPLTGAFLAVAVGALAYRARERRGFRPFALGLVAAGLVLVGKFHFESDPAMYGGIALLVTASVWNTWPSQQPSGTSCSACTPTEQGDSIPRGATTAEVSQ